MAKRGARCKLTPERQKKILKCLRDGLTDKATCHYCGINQDTFYRWLKEKSDFNESVHEARAKAEKELYGELVEIARLDLDLESEQMTPNKFNLLTPIINAKMKNIHWMLSHRYPETYAERKIQESKIELKSPYEIMTDAVDSGGEEANESD